MSDIEHVLVPSSKFPGLFALNHPGGHPIPTGHRFLIVYDRSWHEGRVEYDPEQGGYYFQSADGMHSEPLKAGMIVRLPDWLPD
jgi:hypothetical protein